MKNTILILMCAMLALAACVRNTAVKERLLAVESIIEEYPDSALAVLRSMDSVSVNKIEETQALHALLLTQAFDKNYIDVEDDSLISIAVRFYEESDYIFHRMLAHFYHGRVLYNAEKYPQSLISTLQAFQEAESIDDKFWLAMSARSLSDIYNKTHHGPAGIKYALIASDNFKASGHDIHHLWAMADLATAYNNNGDYDSSIVVAQELLDSAINHSNNSLQTIATRLIGRSYFGRDKYADAIPYYIKVCSDSNRATVEDSAHLAILHINNNQTEEAEILLNAISDKETKCSQWMQYEIYSKTGKTAKALSSLEKEHNRTNNKFNKLIQQNINGALSDYHQMQLQLQEAERKVFHLTIFIISLLFIGVIIWFAFLWMRQRKRTMRQKEIEANLREYLDIKEKECTQAEESIRNLLNNKFKELDRLCQLYDNTGDNEKLKPQILKESEQLFKGLSIKGRTIAELEADVNKYASNIVADLRQDIPNMAEETYKLYLYTKLGFTPAAISLLLNVNDITKVYSRKKRLIAKIHNLPEEKRRRYEDYL